MRNALQVKLRYVQLFFKVKFPCHESVKQLWGFHLVLFALIAVLIFVVTIDLLQQPLPFQCAHCFCPACEQWIRHTCTFLNSGSNKTLLSDQERKVLENLMARPSLTGA